MVSEVRVYVEGDEKEGKAQVREGFSQFFNKAVNKRVRVIACGSRDRAYRDFKRMTTITLELPSEVYHRLHKEADRLGKLPQVVAQEWLIERLELPTSLTPVTDDDRERVHQVLQEAGLLTELGPNLHKLADSSTASLKEVRASLDQVGSKPLSEIILEQRGLKE